MEKRLIEKVIQDSTARLKLVLGDIKMLCDSSKTTYSPDALNRIKNDTESAMQGLIRMEEADIMNLYDSQLITIDGVHQTC